MLQKHSILWIILSHSVNSKIVVFLCLLFAFCYLGIALKNVMLSGVPVSLHHLGFLMEFVRVVFFLLSSLPFIWMVYCLNWLSVVLVVIGKICLLGVFVMLTTLFYLLHVPLL